MTQSLPAHRTELARDLLDDIELSRLPAAQLLLKAVRLASLSDNEDVSRWLHFELNGYVNNDPISIRYMGLTNRWTNQANAFGWWAPLAEIEARAKAMELELQQLQIPNVQVSATPKSQYEAAWTSVDLATKPAMAALKRMEQLTNTIGQLGGIKSRVLSQLHDFVALEFYKLEFSGLAESVFEKHKTRVDGVLQNHAGGALAKIPAIHDRLTEGDPEAISQALNTCRRIIDAFADAVYPAREEPVVIEGKPVAVGNDKTLNRINQYVTEKTTSRSRRERIRKTLSHLYERVCAGVHDDVTLDEALTLFFQTYLTLGEIALLGNEPSPLPTSIPPDGGPPGQS
jgi:hypothetical protein